MAVSLQERMGLEKYATAQMYYSLVGRGLEHEFQSFAQYANLGILVWSPLAGGFLPANTPRTNPPAAGTRFADAGQFVPFDKETGYRVVDALKEVAGRHGVSCARVALAWVLSRPAVASVIIAARKPENLEDNIKAVDLTLSEADVRQLDTASDPGVPYPKWMVLQLDTAEDPRPRRCCTPSAMPRVDRGRTCAGRSGRVEASGGAASGSPARRALQSPYLRGLCSLTMPFFNMMFA